jgi:hypothetical protein
MKPQEFCWWLFDLLGVKPDDDFVDLFHGSGAVKRAWESYRKQPVLFSAEKAPKQGTLVGAVDPHSGIVESGLRASESSSARVGTVDCRRAR